jgi:hypothetical protein
MDRASKGAFMGIYFCLAFGFPMPCVPFSPSLDTGMVVIVLADGASRYLPMIG